MAGRVRYDGFTPRSAVASRVARAASRKRDTKPEVVLRKALWRAGLRGYRVDERNLPGRPDVVFTRARVAIFCDGDFWHGRDLDDRIARLAKGHNAGYWVPKIRGNVARDRRHDEALTGDGWVVLRFWESEILRNVDVIVACVRRALEVRGLRGRR